MVHSLQPCLEEQGEMKKRMEKGKEREGGNEGQEWRDGKMADREEERNRFTSLGHCMSLFLETWPGLAQIQGGI